MKRSFAFIIIIVFALSSCDSSKNTTTKLPPTEVAALNGSWELNYITGPRIAFNGLYPNKRPTIIFDVANKRISGNSGCNSYSGALHATAGSISFTDPIAMTRMMCADGALGETTYMEMLKKVNCFNVTDTTLNFLAGTLVMMRFVKR